MLDLAVDAIAVYRLTRLVTADSITQQPRDAVIAAAYTAAGRGEQARMSAAAQGWQGVADADADVPKLAELVTCRWCAGMWVAVAVVVARRFRWWRPIGQALAMGAAAALLAQLEDD